MDTQKFEIEPEEEYRKERGCMGGCLKGCFVMLLLMVIVIGGCTFIVSKNWRGLTADAGDWMIGKTLENVPLAEPEKDEIQEELQRPLNALRNGTLSLGQMDELTQAVLKSPLIPSFAVMAVETHYFAGSGLTADEKQAGRIALSRFVRGRIDKRIGKPAEDAVMIHIADKQGEGWEFRETATDEELRRLIATAQQEADRAGVPADVPQVDPSDEIRRAIDEVMGPPDAPVNNEPIPVPR